MAWMVGVLTPIRMRRVCPCRRSVWNSRLLTCRKDNYFIKVDLSAPVDLQDGSNYKLSLIPTDVPKLRDQALWSNQANSTLFSYGGRSPNGKKPDAGGVWMYSISDGSWEEQKTSVEPVRLIEGGMT